MKKVRAELIGIRVQSVGDDPGSALEIYGDLYIRRVVINASGQPQEAERHPAFHKAAADAVSINLGDIHFLHSAIDVTIFPGEFLWLGGHLAEQDTFGPNDNLGFVDRKIAHDDLGQLSVKVPVIVDYRESSQWVQALFETTVFFTNVG